MLLMPPALNGLPRRADTRYNKAVTPHAGLSTRFAVWAARGGHGATTVAGALGVFLGLPVTSHEPDALNWMWAAHEQGRQAKRLCIADAGVLSTTPDDARTNIVVLRGPCSLGVRTLARRSDSFDDLVVIREAWRSIRRQDVEAALSVTIAAEITHSPRVARLADAGLLGERVSELDEFAELKEWAASCFSSRAVATEAPMPPPS